MLISVLLYNLEVCDFLSKTDIKLLNDVDLALLRGSLGLSAKINGTLIHAELGLVSVEIILQQRRINYLKHLMSMTEESLARKGLMKQMKSKEKKEWINVVRRNMEELDK